MLAQHIVKPICDTYIDSNSLVIKSASEPFDEVPKNVSTDLSIIIEDVGVVDPKT